MIDQINLNENCTDSELEEAAYEYACEVASVIQSATGWAVNDIEEDVGEW